MSKPLGQQLYELVNKTQFSHGDLEPKEMHEWERIAQQFLSSGEPTEPKGESEFTNPEEYQKLARRTQCDQHEALKRILENSTGPKCFATTLLHGVLGMMGELGELAGAMERWLWYGQKFDEENFIEELGDNDWYEAELHNALDVSMLETMRANIRKLRARYPDKYDDHRAMEENRDRKEEMKQAFGNKEKELLTVEEIQEELSDRHVSCYVICPNCGSKNIDGESSYPSYKCVDCDHCFDHVDHLAKSGPQYIQNGHGWSEPPEESEHREHQLYEKGDEGVPQSIQDSNGDIALGLCKVCGRGEIELEYDNGVCPGHPVDSKPSDIPGGSSEHRHGEGFFLSKEDIDKVLKDTDSFAYKDYPGFPERPMTFDEMGGPVGNGRRVVIDRGDDSKYDLEFWNPFDAARSIADCYAEGQNRGAAYRTIESLENQFNVERCKKLMLAGMAAIRAAGMDLETATLDEVLAFIEVTEE